MEMVSKMKLCLHVGMPIYTLKGDKLCTLTIHLIKKIGKTEYVKCVEATTGKSFTIVNDEAASEKYFYNIAGATALLKTFHKKY